ncbi:MAG: hypothetical protein DRN12_05830 [Thermoplasmata archaeon]|nr:MAG: hypothetical protein DRN12_05830 [Thermoplasmata archaeon]
MIEMKNVTKIYRSGETKVYGLRDVNLSVKKGEFIVVVGPSGCGKSTLLNLIGGIDVLTEGRIIVDGEDLSKLKDKELTSFRRYKVGFVFQFFNLISTLTAVENVELSLKLRNVKRTREEAIRYLEIVGISKLGDRFPSELSGGEQQRVAIARALAKKPSILLADEPTGNLDTKSSEKVAYTLYNSAKNMGTTTILVTHDLGITKFAERIVTLRDGRIVDDRKI